MMAELGVRKIYNADQSGICFEYLPKRTISDRSAKTVWVRCGGRDKDRMTGMFLGDYDVMGPSTRLLLCGRPIHPSSPMWRSKILSSGMDLVFAYQVRALQDEHNVRIYGDKCAWWNSSLTIEFLDYHFANRTQDEPVLLLLDDFSGHWTKEATDYAADLNVFLLKVPPGLTGVCQPAIVSWFKPLKDRLRAQWIANLQAQLEDHDQHGERAASFSLKAPAKGHVVQWILSAWSDISPQIIRSGFHGVIQAVDKAMLDHGGLIERLSTLSAIEETIREEDDVISCL